MLNKTHLKCTEATTITCKVSNTVTQQKERDRNWSATREFNGIHIREMRSTLARFDLKLASHSHSLSHSLQQVIFLKGVNRFKQREGGQTYFFFIVLTA